MRKCSYITPELGKVAAEIRLLHPDVKFESYHEFDGRGGEDYFLRVNYGSTSLMLISGRTMTSVIGNHAKSLSVMHDAITKETVQTMLEGWEEYEKDPEYQKSQAEMRERMAKEEQRQAALYAKRMDKLANEISTQLGEYFHDVREAVVLGYNFGVKGVKLRPFVEEALKFKRK